MPAIDERIQAQIDARAARLASEERQAAFKSLPVAPRDTPFVDQSGAAVVEPYTEGTLDRLASGELRLHPQALYPLVNAETGKAMTATGADVEKLQRHGWQLASDYAARAREYAAGMEEAYGGLEGQAQALVAGGADALTLGLYSGVAGLTGQGETVERSIQYNPGTYTVGLIGGSVLGLTSAGAATGAGRLARGAAGMGERFAAQAGGGLGARILGTGLAGAAEGGIASAAITAGAGLRRGEEASAIAAAAAKEGVLGAAMGGGLGLAGQALIAEPAGAVFRKIRTSRLQNETAAAISDAADAMAPLIRAEGKFAVAEETIARRIAEREDALATLRASQATPEELAAAKADLEKWQAMEADMSRALRGQEDVPRLEAMRNKLSEEVSAARAAQAPAEDIAFIEGTIGELDEQIAAALEPTRLQKQIDDAEALLAKGDMTAAERRQVKSDLDVARKKHRDLERAITKERIAAEKFTAQAKKELASEAEVVADGAAEAVLDIRRSADTAWSLTRLLRRRVHDLDDLATPPTAEYRAAVGGYWDDANEAAYARYLEATDAFDDFFAVPTKSGRTAKPASLSTVQRKEKLVNEGFQTADMQNRVNKRAKAGMYAEFDESGRLLEALDLDKVAGLRQAVAKKMAANTDEAKRIIAELKEATNDLAKNNLRVVGALTDDGVYDVAAVMAHPVEESGKKLFFDPRAVQGLAGRMERGVEALSGLSPLASSGGAARAAGLKLQAAAALDNVATWEMNLAKMADVVGDIRLRYEAGQQVLKATRKATAARAKLEGLGGAPVRSRQEMLAERSAWQQELRELKKVKGPTKAQTDRIKKLDEQIAAAKKAPAVSKGDLDAVTEQRLRAKAAIDAHEATRKEILRTEAHQNKALANREKLAARRQAAKEAMAYKEQMELYLPQMEAAFGGIPREAIAAEAIMMGFDEYIPDEIEFLARARIYSRVAGAAMGKMGRGGGPGLAGRLSEAMLGGAGREVARQGLFANFPGMRNSLAGRGALGALTTGSAHLARAGAKKAFRKGAVQAVEGTGKSIMQLQKEYAAHLEGARKILAGGVRGGVRAATWTHAAHRALASAQYADIEHEAYSGLDPVVRNFERRAAELDAVASDPQKAYAIAMDRVGAAVAPDDPELAHAIAAKVADELVYLQSKLPPPRPRFPGDPRRNPSKAEAEKFGSIVAVHRNPGPTLERMAAGTATPAEAEAAGYLHPPLVQSLVAQATEMLMDGRLGELQRVRLSVSMPIPGPGRPEAALRGQETIMRYEQASQTGAQPPQARPYVKQDIAPPATRAQRLGE